MFSSNFAVRAILCLVIFIILFSESGCGTKAVRFDSTLLSGRKTAQQSYSLDLIHGESIPYFFDDLDWDSLNLAIKRSLQYLERLRNEEVVFLGNRQTTVEKIKETLIAFRDIMQRSEPNNVKEKKIRDAFDFYRSIGDDGKGRVIFTGYYEPILEGSFTKTERYRYPIYRAPENMDDAVYRYMRAEIDEFGVLAGKNLEILWVDDLIDLFFLHVQGSGKIRLPDGSFIQVGYAQSNGYPYRSIANYLLEKGKITKAELSMETIKKYLREHQEDMTSVFNYNERYVFFRIVEGGPFGALNIPVTGGRTIASDPDFFPKGALALISTRKPLLDKSNIVSWESFSRFVLNQDAGVAIKGPGRIDLFCGSGKDAAVVAGSLKEAGELFFLIKK